MHVDHSVNYILIIGSRYNLSNSAISFFKRTVDISQVWWDMPTFPAPWRARQEDHEFEASLELHREILSQ